MPEWIWQFAVIAVGAALGMAVLWEVQRRRQDASLVDVAWTYGIGIGGVFAACVGAGDSSRRLVVGLLVALWALRLGTYLLRDRVVGKPEDGRYRDLRARWGAGAQPRFFVFFQFQAALVALFTLPFLALASDPRHFGSWTDWLGLALWIAGFVLVAAADRTLARWRADPAKHGRTCRAGPWAYSRHPNYFGEWLSWCAYGVIASGGPWWWLPWAIAALLLLLITRVTGIPPTEARALASRGDDYRDYQRTTSAFVPWFPRRATAAAASP